MARPQRLVISSGIASWDSAVDANFSLLFDAPFPMYQVADAGSLPSAANYEKCFALVGSELYYSDGTSWALFYDQGVAANVPYSTSTVLSDFITNYFNPLLAAMKAAGIMEPDP